MSHTPGPWSIIQFGGMQIGHKPSGEAVCTMWGSDDDPTDPKLANARLIAAAPELLEAVKTLSEVFANSECGEVDRRLALKDARAAIAKATGAGA